MILLLVAGLLWWMCGSHGWWVSLVFLSGAWFQWAGQAEERRGR